MNRIKIVNKTQYRLRDLRRIFTAVLRNNWQFYTQPHHVTITCIYRRLRDGFCGGYAYLNSGAIVLKLSKDADKVHHYFRHDDDPAMNIARTLVHELAHCRGLRHGDMPVDSAYDVSYVRGMPLRLRSQFKAKAGQCDHTAASTQESMADEL